MKKIFPIAVMLGLASAGPAAGQTVYSQPGNLTTYNRIELQQIYFHRLKGLREEALRQQAADGGTLSAESRAYLQAKLNRINATRVRDALRNDLMSVNQFGEERRGTD